MVKYNSELIILSDEVDTNVKNGVYASFVKTTITEFFVCLFASRCLSH